MTARQLRVKELQCPRYRQAAAGPDGVVGSRPDCGLGWAQLADRAGEALLGQVLSGGRVGRRIRIGRRCVGARPAARPGLPGARAPLRSCGGLGTHLPTVCHQRRERTA